MKKNQMVLAAALMASLTGLSVQAATVTEIPGGYQVEAGADVKASVSGSGLAAFKGDSGVTLTENGVAASKGDSTISVRNDGIALNGKNVTVNGTNVGDVAAQVETNRKDIANLTYNAGTQLGYVKEDIKDVNAKADANATNIKKNADDIANLTYNTGTQLGYVKEDIKDVDAKAEQNKKDIANLTYNTGTQLGYVKEDIKDIKGNLNYQTAEQNKERVDALKKETNDKIDGLAQNTKENFDSVNKQLAGQSKVNADQDSAISANTDAIKANSEKLNQQGQVLTEHGAQLDHLSNEVYENQQAIEKEQNAREDADTAIRKDFAAADEKTLSDAKAYTDSVSKELGSRIDSIDKSNKKGVAKAAALAALHPQDYDPNAKWDFAAGFGNYGGENATALGAFYRPNRNVMFSLGGTLGGDDNAVNVGLSFKLGHAGQKVEEGSETTAKLYDMIGELQKKLDDQQKKIEALEAKEAK